MKNNLEERLIYFASHIIGMCNSLEKNFTNKHLGQQLIRSSTSSALNYGEAQAAESRRDFIHKMKLVLKELKESFICIKILQSQPTQSTVNFTFAIKENKELIAIFVTSLKTAQAGLKSQNA